MKMTIRKEGVLGMELTAHMLEVALEHVFTLHKEDNTYRIGEKDYLELRTALMNMVEELESLEEQLEERDRCQVQYEYPGFPV